MTKEQLIKENQRLKDQIIELQAEIIRLKDQVGKRETKIIEKEIIRERDYPPIPYPYYPTITYGDGTANPFPEDLYTVICWS